MKSVIFKEVAPTDLEIDARELSARLGGYCSACSNIADKYISDLISVCTPKYTARLVRVEYDGDGVIIGGTRLGSAALIKNLAGVSSAYLLCATLGIGVDRYLNRLAARSGAEHYIADGVASAMAEALCSLADDEICRTVSVKRPRFSPGYADLPLSYQRDLLSLTDAAKLCGVTLTDSYLMIPMKSITAIIGVKNE